jgi:hypothetical protein
VHIISVRMLAMSATLEVSIRDGLTNVSLENGPTRHVVVASEIVTGYPTKGESIYRDFLIESVGMARESYGIYGDVPITDESDERSIVGVSWRIEGTSYEVATLRLVRFVNSGELVGSEDSDMFVVNSGKSSVPVIDCLLENGIEPKNVVSMSRLAKASNLKSGSWLPIVFAYMQLDLCRKAKEEGVTHLMSQQHPTLPDALSYNGSGYPFKEIAEFLGINNGRATLNRSDDAVWRKISSFPGYFLSARSFKQFLESQGVDVGGKVKPPQVLGLWNQHVAPFQDRLNMVREGSVADGSFLSLATVDEWESSAREIVKKYESK